PTSPSEVDGVEDDPADVLPPAAAARHEALEARVEQTAVGLLHRVLVVLLGHPEPAAQRRRGPRHPAAVRGEERIGGVWQLGLCRREAVVERAGRGEGYNGGLHRCPPDKCETNFSPMAS